VVRRKIGEVLPDTIPVDEFVEKYCRISRFPKSRRSSLIAAAYQRLLADPEKAVKVCECNDKDEANRVCERFWKLKSSGRIPDDVHVKKVELPDGKYCVYMFRMAKRDARPERPKAA